jgi:hypothetical protein
MCRLGIGTWLLGKTLRPSSGMSLPFSCFANGVGNSLEFLSRYRNPFSFFT